MPKYRIYQVGRDERVLGVDTREFAGDAEALEHARTLLGGCQAVDVLRGALRLPRQERSPEMSLEGDDQRRPWWFKASPPPKWLRS